MPTYIPLVLVQDNRPSRNSQTWFIFHSNNEFLVVWGCLLFASLPNVNLSSLKGCLSMSSKDLIDHSSQNTRTSGKERIKCMQDGQFWIGTEQIIHVDRSESISHIIDDGFNHLCEVGMTWCCCNETVPEAHAMIDRSSRLNDIERVTNKMWGDEYNLVVALGSTISETYLILWNHKSNVWFHSQIQICFQHNIHIGVDTSMNQQGTIPKQVGLEGPWS